MCIQKRFVVVFLHGHYIMSVSATATTTASFSESVSTIHCRLQFRNSGMELRSAIFDSLRKCAANDGSYRSEEFVLFAESCFELCSTGDGQAQITWDNMSADEKRIAQRLISNDRASVVPSFPWPEQLERIPSQGNVRNIWKGLALYRIEILPHFLVEWSVFEAYCKMAEHVSLEARFVNRISPYSSTDDQAYFEDLDDIDYFRKVRQEYLPTYESRSFVENHLRIILGLDPI